MVIFYNSANQELGRAPLKRGESVEIPDTYRKDIAKITLEQTDGDFALYDYKSFLNFLYSFSNVTSLNLSNLGLSYIPNNFITYFPNLCYLDLSGNLLMYPPYDDSRRIQIISDNNLYYPNDAFNRIYSVDID